ncbi:hypothetical protein BDP81DRAFT_95719 [Colletotrichum phormii]|uniref:Uncharacterized protein n=1 Tax=Colletotrichum phormii TaxID=359342 RepID=A0AAI9ZJH1_9PEZI|nr:uncharacterized protein BDP81DRAFT_95719 [Colletotrichum phormii]KAK1625363.1 hypothetical protein BDP81DRAFT_95719 [Colletotrichum phormii]
MDCRTCGKVFKRKGHLTRHSARHSKDKPFHCDFCGRKFARRDSLFRHAALHDRDTPSRQETRVEMTRRCEQACVACASSKQRCQGGTPCWRCLKKGLSYCRKGQTSTVELQPDRQFEEEEESNMELNEDERSQETTTTNISGICGIRPSAPTEKASETFLGVEDVETLAPDIPPWLPPQEIISIQTPRLDPLLEPCQFNLGLDIGLHQQQSDAIELGLQLHDPPGVSGYADCTMAEGSSGIFRWPYVDGAFHETFHFSEDGLLNIWQNMFTQEAPTPHIGSASEYRVPHATEARIPRADSVENALESSTLKLTFPSLKATDDATIQSEDFGLVREIDEQEYQAILKFWKSQKGTLSLRNDVFPRREVLNTFVQLYFEHFDCQFPCVHHSQVEAGNRPWILLLALAATGSQYSEVSRSFDHALALQELLRIALKSNAPTSPASTTVFYVQSLLLRDTFCVFAGSGRNRFLWQCERSHLVFSCQMLLSTTKLQDSHDEAPLEASMHTRWENWVTQETRRRVIHCAFHWTP